MNILSCPDVGLYSEPFQTKWFWHQTEVSFEMDLFRSRNAEGCKQILWQSKMNPLSLQWGTFTKVTQTSKLSNAFIFCAEVLFGHVLS